MLSVEQIILTNANSAWSYAGTILARQGRFPMRIRQDVYAKDTLNACRHPVQSIFRFDSEYPSIVMNEIHLALSPLAAVSLSKRKYR